MMGMTLALLYVRLRVLRLIKAAQYECHRSVVLASCRNAAFTELLTRAFLPLAGSSVPRQLFSYSAEATLFTLRNRKLTGTPPDRCSNSRFAASSLLRSSARHWHLRCL